MCSLVVSLFPCPGLGSHLLFSGFIWATSFSYKKLRIIIHTYLYFHSNSAILGSAIGVIDVVAADDAGG